MNQNIQEFAKTIQKHVPDDVYQVLAESGQPKKLSVVFDVFGGLWVPFFAPQTVSQHPEGAPDRRYVHFRVVINQPGHLNSG